MSKNAEREIARGDYEKYKPIIEKIKRRMTELGLTSYEKTYVRKRAEFGLEMSHSRFSKAISSSICANRVAALKTICTALDVSFDEDFSERKFGGYSYKANEWLIGKYALVRPCFDKKQFISVFESEIFKDSNYGCLRIKSIDENGNDYFGDISILNIGIIEFNMIEGGFNFLGIVYVDAERRALRGMLMTLGLNNFQRWVPMCVPVALLRDYKYTAEAPYIVKDENEYETNADILESVVDAGFVETVGKLRAADSPIRRS